MLKKILSIYSKLSPKEIAILAIFLGSILRLIFPYDIEFKFDQELMLDWMKDFHLERKFRDIGMMSGGQIYNFGLGVWLFYLLGYVSLSPVGVTMTIAMINVLCLYYLFYIIHKYIEKDNRDLWYYSLALLSVSILPIILSRNIWIQSILLPFSFTIIALFFSRNEKFLPSLILGCLLVLIGQIHLSGIFMCFTFGLIILMYHFYHIKKIHLKGFFLGGIIGAIPMYTYLIYLFSPHEPSIPNSNWGNISDLRILWMHIFDGLGLDIFYTLESKTFLFFQYPRIFDTYTYLNGFLYLGIIVLVLIAMYNLIKNGKLKLNLNQFKNLDHTSQFLLSSFSIYFILTISRSKIYSHYFIITYPFIQILAIKIMSKNDKLIRLLIVFNLILSISFMLFIHQTGGFEDSFYGKTYKQLLMK